FDRSTNGRLRSSAGSNFHEETEPLASHFGNKRLSPVARIVRQCHVVAWIWLRENIHEQRGVGNCAAHWAGHSAQIWRIDRDAAQTGLQREDSVISRGQSHRASDIGAECKR